MGQVRVYVEDKLVESLEKLIAAIQKCVGIKQDDIDKEGPQCRAANERSVKTLNVILYHLNEALELARSY